MDDENLIGFIQTYVYPHYLGDVWIPVKRLPLDGKRGLMAQGWDRIVDAPKEGSAGVVIDTKEHGYDLLFVALHEIGHVYLLGQYAKLGKALGMRIGACAALHNPAEERSLNRWAEREADVWWWKIQRARRSKASWHNFLRGLEAEHDKGE